MTYPVKYIDPGYKDPNGDARNKASEAKSTGFEVRWMINHNIEINWLSLVREGSIRSWNYLSFHRCDQGKTMECKLSTFPKTTALTYLEDIHLRQYEIKETWLLIQIIAMTEYIYSLDDFT